MNNSSYMSGLAAGILIRGVPLSLAYPGKQYWVSSSTTVAHQLKGVKPGSDTGATKGTYNDPFATIDYAVGRCTASRGDVIFVKPNYTQTIADATSLLLDVAGVAVIGLGGGTSRPTLTFSAATSNIPVSAANVAVYNILFTTVTATTDVASLFTVSGTALASDFTVQKCEFRDTATTEAIVAVITDNATAQNLAGLYFADNEIISLSDAATTTTLKIDTASNRMKLLRNFGTYRVLNDEPAFLKAGAADHLQFAFGDNILNKPSTESSTEATFISGTGTGWTGHCYRNLLWQLDGAAGIWITATTKLAFSENYSPITGAAEKSGLINPAAV